MEEKVRKTTPFEIGFTLLFFINLNFAFYFLFRNELHYFLFVFLSSFVVLFIVVIIFIKSEKLALTKLSLAKLKERQTFFPFLIRFLLFSFGYALTTTLLNVDNLARNLVVGTISGFLTSLVLTFLPKGRSV